MTNISNTAMLMTNISNTTFFTNASVDINESRLVPGYDQPHSLLTLPTVAILLLLFVTGVVGNVLLGFCLVFRSNWTRNTTYVTLVMSKLLQCFVGMPLAAWNITGSFMPGWAEVGCKVSRWVLVFFFNFDGMLLIVSNWNHRRQVMRPWSMRHVKFSLMNVFIGVYAIVFSSPIFFMYSQAPQSSTNYIWVTSLQCQLFQEDDDMTVFLLAIFAVIHLTILEVVMGYLALTHRIIDHHSQGFCMSCLLSTGLESCFCLGRVPVHKRSPPASTDVINLQQSSRGNLLSSSTLTKMSTNSQDIPVFQASDFKLSDLGNTLPNPNLCSAGVKGVDVAMPLNRIFISSPSPTRDANDRVKSGKRSDETRLESEASGGRRVFNATTRGRKYRGTKRLTGGKAKNVSKSGGGVNSTGKNVSKTGGVANSTGQNVSKKGGGVNTTGLNVSKIGGVANSTGQNVSKTGGVANSTGQDVSNKGGGVNSTGQNVSETCGVANSTGQNVSKTGGVANSTGQDVSQIGGVANSTGQNVSKTGGVANSTGQDVSKGRGVADSTPTAQLRFETTEGEGVADGDGNAADKDGAAGSPVTRMSKSASALVVHDERRLELSFLSNLTHKVRSMTANISLVNSFKYASNTSLEAAENPASDESSLSPTESVIVIESPESHHSDQSGAAAVVPGEGDTKAPPQKVTIKRAVVKLSFILKPGLSFAGKRPPDVSPKEGSSTSLALRQRNSTRSRFKLFQKELDETRSKKPASTVFWLSVAFVICSTPYLMNEFFEVITYGRLCCESYLSFLLTTVAHYSFYATPLVFVIVIVVINDNIKLEFVSLLPNTCKNGEKHVNQPETLEDISLTHEEVGEASYPTPSETDRNVRY